MSALEDCSTIFMNSLFILSLLNDFLKIENRFLKKFSEEI